MWWNIYLWKHFIGLLVSGKSKTCLSWLGGAFDTESSHDVVLTTRWNYTYIQERWRLEPFNMEHSYWLKGVAEPFGSCSKLYWKFSSKFQLSVTWLGHPTVIFLALEVFNVANLRDFTSHLILFYFIFKGKKSALLVVGGRWPEARTGGKWSARHQRCGS